MVGWSVASGLWPACPRLAVVSGGERRCVIGVGPGAARSIAGSRSPGAVPVPATVSTAAAVTAARSRPSRSEVRAGSGVEPRLSDGAPPGDAGSCRPIQVRPALLASEIERRVEMSPVSYN